MRKKCDSLILGNIVTLDSDKCFVNAMTCSNGRIVYTGDKSTALKLCDRNTKIYDYSNKYIYPGFFDSHTHGSMAGQRLRFQCNLRDGKSMEEYVEILRKYIVDNPGRLSYQGAGWINRGEANRHMIDAVCKDVPVILTSADGHSMWVNSICLKECGFDSAKAKEMGTDIVHIDENGEPNGLVSESAMMLILSKYSPNKNEIKEGLLEWQKFAFKKGITACVDASGDAYPDANDAYMELVKEGKWKLRTYAYNVKKKYMYEPYLYIESLKDDIQRYNSEYFKVIGAKFFFDGVVEAHTAFLIDDYEDDPGYNGVFNYRNKEKIAKELIERLNFEEIPIHIHTVGDGAVKFAMDCFEEAQLNNCNFKTKNCLAHLQIVKPDDIKRISEYNVIAIVAPLWVPIDKVYFKSEVDYLGEDRAYNEYPIKSFENAGATICFHTDYPISSNVNFPKSFYIAKKRKDPISGSKSVKNPDEAIELYRSLLAVTANAAYMVNEQENLGKLLPGMVANCVVYDSDLLSKDVESIPNAKLLATIVDGDVVYREE